MLTFNIAFTGNDNLSFIFRRDQEKEDLVFSCGAIASFLYSTEWSARFRRLQRQSRATSMSTLRAERDKLQQANSTRNVSVGTREEKFRVVLAISQ